MEVWVEEERRQEEKEGRRRSEDGKVTRYLCEKGGGTGQVCLCMASDKPQQNERINWIHFIQTPFFFPKNTISEASALTFPYLVYYTCCVRVHWLAQLTHWKKNKSKQTNKHPTKKKKKIV